MKYMKARKLKLEKKLRELKPEIVRNVIARYERFCQDQYTYQMLKWRKRVNYNSLTPKEKIALNLKIAFRQQKRYTLTNCHGDIKYCSSSLGKHVEMLPSCLDPDMEEKKFKKFIETPMCSHITLNQLAECYPAELDFYPSEAVMDKLVRLSMQIKCPEVELWFGYYKLNRQDGTYTYKPIELI